MLDLLSANDRPGEYPPSWYADTAKPLPRQPALQGEAVADVCVIGGGYTGLSAALHLRAQGLDVVLLEAQRLGFGASGRNGGQVGSGQRLDQPELERMFGPQRARALWDMGEEAKATVAGLIAEHGIACDHTPGVIHAEFTDRGARHAAELAAHMQHHYGYDQIEALDRDGIRAQVASPAYAGGVLDRGASHLHPLNYVLGLARSAAKAGVRLHEGSRVTALHMGDPAIVATDTGRVRARFVILACNGYLGGLVPQVVSRVMPINSFIIATEPLDPDRARALMPGRAAVADANFVVNYYRMSQDNRLLFGGGESYGYRFPRDIAAKVRKPMLRTFPDLADLRITHAWGGTLAITMQRLPAFQRLAPNVLSASGYSGHGVALATLAGKLMAEAVAGQAGRFDIMASLPKPRFPGGRLMRWPLLFLAMSWYSLRDRL